MEMQILQNISERHPVWRNHVSHLTVEYNKKIIELPDFAANKSDYDKSRRCGTPLETKIFQFHIPLNRRTNIRMEQKLSSIRTEYGKILGRYSPVITDLNFNWGEHVWTSEERNVALELQVELETSFLSDVIVNRNMESIDIFEEQLDSLDAFNENSIKCPTISLHTPSDMFEQQLDLIIKRKYQRFNVEWAGILQHDSWLLLSKIKEKKIWCNLVGIFRRQGEQKWSNSMIGFVNGCHTCGLGYQHVFGNQNRQPRSWRLSDDAYQYQEVVRQPNQVNMAPEEADTRSHNLLHNKITESQNYIDRQRFFSDFLPEVFDLDRLRPNQ